MSKPGQTLPHKGTDYWNSPVVLSAAANYHDADLIACPYANNPVDITLFISCYNEEAFIVNTLNTVVEGMRQVGKTYEILVIDDGSKDNSVALVKNFIAEHPEIPIIFRINKKNKGWAQNYIDAAFIGRGKYYRVLCGDNSEPVETLVKVFSLLGQADMIVPYYTEFQNKSIHRQRISKIFTSIVNFISGNKIHYYNGLHVHLRHNVMRWHPTTRGFGFQAEMLCTLIDLGFSYQEVACITIERRGGGGNALTWKNVRSVGHSLANIMIRRLAPWH